MQFSHGSTLLIGLISTFASGLQAQKAKPIEPKAIKILVEAYKTDIRGPYKDIRWFCKDGSVRDPKDPCPAEIGPGIQHARYKESVEGLAKNNQIYLGQILAYTTYTNFWDAENNFSRLKQYQLEKYLRTVDDGWILRKGQYYRGALQVEDEEAWGRAFYNWLLAKDENLQKHFFLIRQSLRDVPHRGDDNVAQLMRSQSKIISDELTSFMNLRVKIHGQPEAGDIAQVTAFKAKNKAQLSAEMNRKFDELLATMERFYSPFNFQDLQNKSAQFKSGTITTALNDYAKNMALSATAEEIVVSTAQLLLTIRTGIMQEEKSVNRLELLDLSLQLEELIFKNAPKWEVQTVEDLYKKLYALAMANAGAGYVELWEWDKIEAALQVPNQPEVTLASLMRTLEAARGEVEWSAAMVKATYQPTVNAFYRIRTKGLWFHR